MPPKRKTPRKSQKGAGVVKDVLKFVRDNKLISKGLGMIPHPAAQVAAKGASLVGLGKKKKKKRGPKKITAAVSMANLLGASPTRTRKTPVRVSKAVAHGFPRNQVGAGFFSDLGGGIGNIFGGLGGGIGSVAKGMFGGGARGRMNPRVVLPIPQEGFVM